VRLSGPRAIEFAQAGFSVDLAEFKGFTAVSGIVRIGSDRADSSRAPYTLPPTPYALSSPARLYLFRAPRSYTRQDVVELHVPGEVVASLVLEQLLQAGARQAQAGEFTARAFFSGRLDLARAQAVADIIDAEADAQLRSAIGMLEGELTRLCRQHAETITQALALVEASIDFADEPIELDSPSALAGRIEQACHSLQRVLSESGAWISSSSQPHVAIAGSPNAGKSSLLNALSGFDRAIVSSVAGTTRDVLSAPARLPNGCEVVLLDAAGLEASDDPLWQTAHQSARQAAASAEAVLFVVDATATGFAPQALLLAEIRGLLGRTPVMAVATKVDLLTNRDSLGQLARVLGDGPLLPVSAVTGEGLDALKGRLAEVLHAEALPHSGRLLLHGRQRRGLSLAVAAGGRAARILQRSRHLSDEAELAAVELRSCLYHLQEISGQVVSEDILSAIFSRFCIGK
jgi:tRNA modification GTPase